MPREIYDSIVESYSKTDSSLTKEYVARPTLISLLGNTKGKKVIDLGCGSGYSTRVVKVAGAEYVCGVDISSKQILLAQGIENKQSLGINYYQCNINDYSFLKFKDFDIATALYLLHYSSTRDELYNICKNIYHALRPGGRFVAINSNPETPILTNMKYGITAEINAPIVEGAVRRVTYLEDPNNICSFETYFWRKDTYEKALAAAGFEKIEWHRSQVSEDGKLKFGVEFWTELLENPFICGLTCVKSF